MKLKEKLYNEVLPLVSKPGRYLGNEYNVIIKDHSKVELKIALSFPDVYDLGMSHLGLKIFYETLNSKPNFVAERVFAPWIDMEKTMRDKGIQLYTLETYTPVKEFDLFAISLQHELCYTTVLNMLDLAGIPVFSEKRTEKDPIIIAGGHATFNPEPMSPFIDAFVIGDGEEAILEIAELLLKCKKEQIPRKDILVQLAKLKGIYVPSLFQVDYTENGFIKEIKPIREDIPKRISRRVVDLEDAQYPLRQLVPYIEIAHDRVALEIQRGCTRGCRFCQAGYITRPRRERTIDTLFKQATIGIGNTGLNEVALLSLSSSDYDGIKELVTRMVNYFEPFQVSLSLPSLRLDTFSIDVAKQIQRIKKTGFTFAVEAGSERLRNVINKTVTDEDLDKAIIQVFSNGWLSAKLYFMIGLPTETYEDLNEMAKLIEKTGQLARKHAKRHCQVTASISVFVPKAHSAFETVPQVDRIEVQKRIFWVKDRIKSKVVKLKWHDPEQSYLEGVFSRGDRRVSMAIYRAWQKGCYLDNWSDQFKKELWEKAFQECNIDADFFGIRERRETEIMPWSHIDSGVTKTFLTQEYEDAVKEKTLGDCSMDKFCVACGVEDCTHAKANQKFLWPFQKNALETELNSEPLEKDIETPSTLLRVKFSKKEDLRFISHLDLVRTFAASIRRAGLPIAFSKGFSPQMKFHFAQALSLGYTSITEYAEFELTQPMTADEFIARLSPYLPAGIELLNGWGIDIGSPGFVKLMDMISYRVSHFSSMASKELLHHGIQDLLSKSEVIVNRESKDGIMKQMDIRPMIESLTCQSGTEPVLDMLIKVNPTGTVRPEEIIRSIYKEIDEKTIKLLHITRTGIYTITNDYPQPLEWMWDKDLYQDNKLSEIH